jgi:type II secretory pathway component PulK
MTRRRDRGVALIIVLFLSALLTLLMYTFLREMQVEYGLATSIGREAQARQLAWSAVEKASVILAAETSPVAGPSSKWFDDPDEWYEVELGDGVYSMIRMTPEADGKLRYGIMDEAARFNLNTIPKEILLKLPKATEEIADAIIDWRDADENQQPSGAENSYYQSLPKPYRCKNTPFTTVEELLLVKGMTPEILYGEDWNQNGILDANENDGDKSPPADNSDGILDFGFIAFLTVHTYERNVSNDGQPRVDLNTATPEQLQQTLGSVLSPAELQQIPTRRPYPSVAHLLPMIPMEKWKQIVDRVSIMSGTAGPPLLNVNTASKKVLEMIPGMTPDDVSKLVAHRTQEGADLSTLGWLADALQGAEQSQAAIQKLQQIVPYLTTRSFQFRFDVVARIGPKSEREATTTTTKKMDSTGPPPPARVMKRLMVILDRGQGGAGRIVYARDVTRLGQPYPKVPAEPDNEDDKSIGVKGVTAVCWVVGTPSRGPIRGAGVSHPRRVRPPRPKGTPRSMGKPSRPPPRGLEAAGVARRRPLVPRPLAISARSRFPPARPKPGHDPVPARERPAPAPRQVRIRTR